MAQKLRHAGQMRRLWVALIALPIAAWSQEPGEPEQTDTLEEIVVVGTRIAGLSEEALPVTVMNSDMIEDTAAFNMMDILSYIPSVGDFDFNDNNNGTNGARGDVAGANLRGLGSSNTLVLLNGRRLVVHPTFQSFNNTPAIFYNVNSLPSGATRRIEVLRDGASPLYGADATGGVVNFVTYREYDGITIGGRHAAADDTNFDESELTFNGGWQLNEGRSSFNVFATYYERSRVEMSELDELYFELDRRQLDAIPEVWRGDSQLRNTSTLTPYARFRVGSLDENGLFSGSLMHVDPATGELRSGGGSARYNFNETAWVTPDVERTNLMATFNHRMDNGMEFFADAYYYDANSRQDRAGSPFDLSLAYIIVPAGATHNPFDGDVLIEGWRPTDLGPREIEVEQDTYRLMGGLRGQVGSWDWESALLYSEAEATDTEGNRQAKSRFQAQLLVPGSAGLNPFVGPGGNTDEAIAGIRVSATDVRTSELALWDVRFTQDELFSAPGGGVGAAFGAEWRREEYFDDRDPRLDGSMPFNTGVSFDESDLVGVSATFDSGAHRNTASAYGELWIPLVGAGNEMPIAKSLEFQLAARYENTSDFGDTFKPKIGFRWEPFRGFSFRGSYAEGFRAPNLPQMNQGTVVRRIQGVEDPLREEVTGLPIDTGDVYRVTTRVANPDLGPESSETWTVGFVFAPTDGPLSNLRVTFDLWDIDQTNVVGILDPDDALALDELMRSQGGGFNPDVERAPVTALDQMLFDAWNAANPNDQRVPVGVATNIINQYINLDPRHVDGWDASLLYATQETSLGVFTFRTDVSKITEFEQLGLATTDLLRRNGNPEWRATAGISWDWRNWDANVNARYVSEVYDTSLFASGVVNPGIYDPVLDRTYWKVDSWTVYNIAAGYSFPDGDGLTGGLRLSAGVRNLTNEDPPFADESFGYLSELHNSYGRIFWARFTKSF